MTILDTPKYRKLVQENRLAAKFEEALFPELMFRDEAAAEPWGDQTGDTKIFTGKGLIPVTTAPVQAMADPDVSDYQVEQWSVTLATWGKSKDTHAPTSSQAAQKLILDDIDAIGKNAGQTLNRLCRDNMINAALSGHTVADGAQGPTTTLRVKRLNGFTRARRPDLVAGSAVRFDAVSASNPLAIRYGNTLATSVNVVGFTPDTAGDEVGPGTLTLSANATVLDRDAIVSTASTWLRRSGGGFRVDELGASDVLVFGDLRATLSRLANMEVPKHADGYYHGHMDPISKNQIFNDNEWQRLHETLPEGLAYGSFAIGKRIGAIWFENNECPQLHNVNIPNGSTDGATGDNYSVAREAFAGELFPTGTPTSAVGKVHRVLVTGAGWLREYAVDQDSYTTDAGINGKLSEVPQVGNGSVQLMAKGVKLIQRAPQNRFQDIVAQTWRWVGGFVCRTDAATGDGAYYKRGAVIEHIEPA